MSSILADYNTSILAIPAYYILSALPHVFALRVVTKETSKPWDNRNPRSTTMKAKLKEKLPLEVYDQYERLEACHYNGMENLPLFASSVILGNMAGLQQGELTKFVASYLAVRVAYTAVYMVNTTRGLSACRSVLWLASISLCMRTLFRAAGAIGSK